MPKASIDISFVILTWNSAAYVQQCLDSIALSLKSLDCQYEVIVVDNGSSDQTEEILAAYQENQPETIKPVFLLDNKGTTLSRNIGLMQAKGRLLCVMDSDVVLSDGLFQPLIERLDSDPSVGMVVPKILYPSGGWQKSFDQYPTLMRKAKRFFGLKKIEGQEGARERDNIVSKQVDYAISAFWLFKREVLVAAGYLDENIFYSPEDVDFCLRVWRSGYKIIYDPSVSIVHHTQEISRGFKLNRAKISHFKGLLYLFYKHRYFFKPPKFAENSEITKVTDSDLTGLKVLHVFDHSLPLHDGYSFRSLNILREQKKRGWQPICLTSPKHEENLQQSCEEKEEIEGFTFYRSGLVCNRIPLFGELWLMHVLSRRIRNVAQIERPDVIHVHSPILNAIPALWAGRRLNLPVIYEIRAFWEDAAVDQGQCKEWGLRYKLTRAVESWVCKKADHIAILCDGLKNDLIDRGIPANKITPVFNGVNVDDFQPCPIDEAYLQTWGLHDKKIVGFIGSFYHFEGLDLLVKAFAAVAKEHPDSVLLLVGGGEMEEELSQLVDALNLNKRVLMPGRISHDRVPGIYEMIDILAYPRYAMRLTELVTPLKPLEAMAMGKALIASDVGGHRELIRHEETGVLFEAGNEPALTAALKRLLDDSQLCRDLQRKGRSWVLDYQTWQKTTAVYTDIYRQVFI